MLIYTSQMAVLFLMWYIWQIEKRMPQPSPVICCGDYIPAYLLKHNLQQRIINRQSRRSTLQLLFVMGLMEIVLFIVQIRSI